MKLTIVACLAMFAAVCYATSNKASNKEAVDLLKRLLEQKSEAKGLQKKTHEFRNVKVLDSMKLISKLRKMKADKARALAHKHVDANCDNAYVEIEDEDGVVEEGIILYPKDLASLLPSDKRTKRDDGCTFHIKTDEDHELFFYVLKWHSGDDELTCENGVGQLSMFEGDSDQGEEIGHACGDFEYAFVPEDVHEVFITFTPDEEHDVEFFIYYEIVTTDQILASVDHGEGEEDESHDASGDHDDTHGDDHHSSGDEHHDDTHEDSTHDDHHEDEKHHKHDHHSHDTDEHHKRDHSHDTDEHHKRDHHTHDTSEEHHKKRASRHHN